jgi:hypothetical protein
MVSPITGSASYARRKGHVNEYRTSKARLAPDASD